jgi:hypothetical protein
MVHAVVVVVVVLAGKGVVNNDLSLVPQALNGGEAASEVQRILRLVTFPRVDSGGTGGRAAGRGE